MSQLVDEAIFESEVLTDVKSEQADKAKLEA